MKADPDRIERMCSLYRAGHTLQQIGTVYGVTRERVRQIVTKAGVTRTQGGVGRRRIDRQTQALADRALRDEAKAQANFGCSYAELLSLNDGRRGWTARSRAKAFLDQRRNAAVRGIEWRMTFPEWCLVWSKSGKWDCRGRTADRYVMARRQDFGPYAVWNVYITTLAQNVADYQAELKKRGVECTDGYPRLPERAESLGVAA